MASSAAPGESRKRARAARKPAVGCRVFTRVPSPRFICRSPRSQRRCCDCAARRQVMPQRSASHARVARGTRKSTAITARGSRVRARCGAGSEIIESHRADMTSRNAAHPDLGVFHSSDGASARGARQPLGNEPATELETALARPAMDTRARMRVHAPPPSLTPTRNNVVNRTRLRPTWTLRDRVAHIGTMLLVTPARRVSATREAPTRSGSLAAFPPRLGTRASGLEAQDWRLRRAIRRLTLATSL